MIASGIKVYPTLVEEYLTIESPNTARVDVYNMLGEKLISVDSFNSGQLNVTSLGKGMYILNVTTDEGKAAFRFIKK